MANPFDETAVDLIGPWRVQIPGMGELELLAATFTDMCTMLTEVVRVELKHADHVAM